MRYILNMEFSYNKYLFIGTLCFTPFLAYHKIHPVAEDVPLGTFIFMIMFLPAMTWNTSRNKENREYQLAQLPISRFRMALSRIGMVIITGLMVSILYSGSLFILGFREVQAFHSSLVPLGLIIGLFSLYFVLRDLFLNFLRNNTIFPMNRERTKTLLMAIVLGLNLLGFYFFFTAAKQKLDFVGTFFRFFAHHPLIITLGGNAIWMACSLLLAGLTLITFSVRKSCLE